MECPHIPEIAYGDFSKRLHQKVSEERIPIVGSMELTFRCNVRCQHCYVSHGHQGIPSLQELTTKEIHNILDQVVDEGCLWLLLTGGEPLMRRDFLEVYTYAKRKGLLLTLFTNGTMLSPRMADAFAEWRPFSIEISIYGYTQETYERVTGIPGSHAHCMRGIELLLERDLPLKLKTMVMTINQHEVQEMKSFAERLGLVFRYDPMLNGGLNGNDNPTVFRIPPEEVVQLDLADSKRVEEWQRFCKHSLDSPNNYGGYLYNCGAGIHSFHIDPYGKLSVCMISRAQEYELRMGTFQEGWREFMPKIRNQPAPASFNCNQCELFALCGQCPGWAELEYGMADQPVDYLCQVAHQRAKAFRVPEYSS